MSLSEGKMFTIEALNRIEGFAWPEGATFGEVDGGRFVYFYASDEGIQGAISSARIKQDDDPMTLHVQITREEFESVDGWVRNDESMLSSSALIDIKTFNGVVNSKVRYESNFKKHGNAFDIEFWRYHKPQRQEVKPEPESNASVQLESKEGIESLISKHKAVKEIARLARIELERVEAAEHSLMLSIEAWAESHGFDIRALDESDENPEIVITDWRDLRVGDIVSWSALGSECECEVTKLPIYTASEEPYIVIMAANQITYGACLDEIKFIRRPEKK